MDSVNKEMLVEEDSVILWGRQDLGTTSTNMLLLFHVTHITYSVVALLSMSSFIRLGLSLSPFYYTRMITFIFYFKMTLDYISADIIYSILFQCLS